MKTLSKIALLILMMALVGCGPALYCLRVGDNYPGHFVCTDKDELVMDELDLSMLRGEKVPDDWGRVKIKFRPFYPIAGHSVWPLWGYSMENYNYRYNDGTPIQ